MGDSCPEFQDDQLSTHVAQMVRELPHWSSFDRSGAPQAGHTWRVPAEADVTGLLLRWSAGDAEALERLTPVVYDDLKRLARALLRQERPSHTLSPTALVHETYLRLVDQRRVAWKNRTYFFGAAAHIMRRVLVDHARAHTSHKRGGSSVIVAIEDDTVAIEGFSAEILDLDLALNQLAHLDPRKVQVIEMKYFAGMTNQEIAAALDLSHATVERDWKLARAWLIRAMHGGT
jgi:RNA polymerase sigma factor (TIGR02999 family)